MKKYLLAIFISLFFTGCSTNIQKLSETQLVESMAFQILTQKDSANREYCLKVLGKPPTDSLTNRLNALGQNPNSCKNDGGVYISNLNFYGSEYHVKYSYYCGDLCAAEFECVFEVGTPEPTLKKCTMAWISLKQKIEKLNIEKT